LCTVKNLFPKTFVDEVVPIGGYVVVLLAFERRVVREQFIFYLDVGHFQL
jgi:hypothetical protein